MDTLERLIQGITKPYFVTHCTYTCISRYTCIHINQDIILIHMHVCIMVSLYGLSQLRTSVMEPQKNCHAAPRCVRHALRVHVMAYHVYSAYVYRNLVCIFYYR